MELNFVSGALRTIDRDGTRYDADPTGQLVLCQCKWPGLTSDVFAVFATNDPTRKRLVQFAGNPVRVKDAKILYWAVPNSHIESIAVDTAVGTAIASTGQFVVYDVLGTNTKGLVRSVPNFQWSSGDTSIATIDSTGKAHFLKEGTARFTVTAGGWRTYAFDVPVKAATFESVLNESWNRELTMAWIVFGTPSPTIQRSGSSSTLHINGDGHDNSGVFSKYAIDESQGAGVNVHVRLPIDSSQWQSLSLALDPIATDKDIANWAQRELGALPGAWVRSGAGHRCMLSAPMAEGGEYLDLIGLTAGEEDVRPLKPIPRITDGRWHTVTIQTFLDGRCGFGVDGIPVAISTTSMSRGRPLRVMISGQSVGTKVEVGPLEAWQGLRTDIDWSQLQRSAVRVSPSR